MKNNLSDNLRSAYLSAIGKKCRELVTPALILDLDIARRNISTMTEKLSHLHAKLRPHVKVQKCTELALMQVEAGAIGVCTATVWEAITMSRAGIKDVLIANEVVGKEKIKALALSDEKIVNFISGKKVLREIYVPKKLVNIVVQ